MSGKYLLDTNIIIDLLQGDDSLARKIDNSDRVCIPVNTLGELFYGAYNSSRVEQRLKEPVHAAESFEFVQATEVTARHYGEIKAQLRKKGNPIPENDIWIAATALEHDLTVLTGDKHFENIDGLS